MFKGLRFLLLPFQFQQCDFHHTSVVTSYVELARASLHNRFKSTPGAQVPKNASGTEASLSRGNRAGVNTKTHVWPHVTELEFTMQLSKSGAAMPTRSLYGTRIPSPRQRQVIELVAQGLKNSEVAEIIGTTQHVVKNHLRMIYDKLGMWNRVELALWYESRRHEDVPGGRHAAAA